MNILVPHPDRRSRLAIAAGALLALLSAHCTGGVGDQPSTPVGSEYGTTKRLCEIFGEATWEDPANMNNVGCAYPQDRGVHVTGVTIIAIDRFDETGDGAVGNYWVQDPVCKGKPFSGMTVFAPSFSPPDLRLANNDVVDMNGQATEFPGPSSGRFPQCRTLPEISGSLSFRFDSDEPPEPVTIDVLDLKVYAKARQWLGMLVKVENISLADNGANSGGRFTAPLNTGAGTVSDRPRITNELYDIEHEGPELKDGGTFKSVTGVVTYFYGFHLVPRSPADFEP